jgi:hypothetical protein
MGAAIFFNLLIDGNKIVEMPLQICYIRIIEGTTAPYKGLAY